MNQLLEIFEALSSCIILGFVLSTLIFIILYLFLHSLRPTINRLILFSNILLLCGALIFLLSHVILIVYECGKGSFEHYAIANRIFGPYAFLYWAEILSKALLPQMLWIRNLRQNIWISVLLIPFVLSDIYFPIIYAFYSYNNFETLSFRHITTMNLLLSYGIFAIIYILILVCIYLITNKETAPKH